LIEGKTRPARSTYATRLSCDSNFCADRATDDDNSTSDRQSTRKNAALNASTIL